MSNAAVAIPPPTEWRPHPGGAAGAKVSLQKCSERIRQDYLDPLVVAFSRRVLQDTPNATSTKSKAQALLSAMKARARYILDPVNSEYIASAALILCLDSTKKDYCHAGGDCDELTCTMCSMLMSVGIEAKLVGQCFNSSGVPSHVLLAAFDPASETWFKIDPSTSLPAGQSYPASSETEVDPLTGAVPDFSGPGPDATFVGVGFIPVRYASGALGYLPYGYYSPRAPRVERAAALGRATAVPDFLRAPARGVLGAPRTAGLGLVTPGDVLAYRAAWNQYVLDTVRVAYWASGEYLRVAQNLQGTPAASTAAGFQAVGNQLQSAGDAAYHDWNLWMNAQQDYIVLEAATILKSFQDTVLQCGRLRTSIAAPPLNLPLLYLDDNGQPHEAVSGPDPNLQAQIIARIQGFGILADGVLQILIQTTGSGLVAVSSAGQWIAQHGQNLVNNAANTASWLLSPWTIGITAFVVAGVAVYVIYKAEDVAKLASAVRP